MKRVILAVAMAFFKVLIFAQDQEEGNGEVSIQVPDVALVDLESGSGKSISLNISASSEAGDPVDVSEARDSSLWMNYSSICSSTGKPQRTIYARIVAGTVPDAFDLRVKPMTYQGSGDGDLGKPANNAGTVLESKDKKIIKDVRSCYTGNGAGNGHQLVYSLELKSKSYKHIDYSESGTVTIAYTISEN